MAGDQAALPLATTITLVALLALAGVIVSQQAAPWEEGPAAHETSEEGVDRVLEVEVQAIDCPDGYDNQADDDICLAYDGQIPGPSWVLSEGEQIRLTFEHNVTDTVEQLDVDDEVAQRLAEARYGLHRHGTSVAACDDGTAKPLGTQVCDSSIGPPGAPGPNGSITYEFTTPFPGPWHYHDHALGAEVGTARVPVLEHEAKQRGLYGSFLVLAEGEHTDRVLDLHLLDSGANGGLGLDAHVQEGQRFDLLAVGLGDLAWDVRLDHDRQGQIDQLEIGPGVSRSITVHEAQPGTYTWTAASTMGHYEQGEVTVG